MSDARLTGLMLLARERDLTDNLSLEKVARECSLLKKRRVVIFRAMASGERFSIDRQYTLTR